ncbi:zinc metalloprotease HtpX [Candidatus Bathyarchaeota archaeon]|nr:zinc metalloprotease HtpX [Candidatus Bathyarchaeota archaeon]
MASLTQLRTTMLATIIVTLVVFVGFLGAVSLLYSAATDMNLSPFATLLGSFVLALIFLGIQFLISPSIVAWSTRLQYLQPGQYPWLENTVKELATSSSVAMPKLAIVPSPAPNAFVFGNSSSNMTLAVHEGLLRQLNEDEVRGVIAHELGHIKHRDSIVMTVLSAIPLLAYMIARSTMFMGTGSRDRDKSAGYLALAGVVALAVYFIAQLLVLRLSRLREHFADVYSGYLTGSPRSLESALTKIAYGLSIRPESVQGVRALYISDPALAKNEVEGILERRSEYDLDHDGVLDERELQLAMEKEARSTWTGVNEAFSTHPPTFKRILLLRQIEAEIKQGTGEEAIYKRI